MRRIGQSPVLAAGVLYPAQAMAAEMVKEKLEATPAEAVSAQAMTVLAESNLESAEATSVKETSEPINISEEALVLSKTQDAVQQVVFSEWFNKVEDRAVLGLLLVLLLAATILCARQIGKVGAKIRDLGRIDGEDDEATVNPDEFGQERR